MGRIVDTRRILASLRVAAPPDALVAVLERVLGVEQFERLCAGARVTTANAAVLEQIADVFAAAEIRWETTEAGAGAEWPSGPLVIYSNHPYGFADALIAVSIALARRPDTKVLANSALAAFDFHTAHTLWVDLGKRAERLGTNRRSLRQAQTDELPQVRAHLRWKDQQRTAAGQMAQRGRCIRVHVGAPVTGAEAAAVGDRAERMQRLREHVYALRAAARPAEIGG